MTEDERGVYSMLMARKAAECVFGLPDVVPALVGQELMVAGYMAVTGVPMERARVELQAIASAAMRESNRISIADRTMERAR